MQYSYLLLQGGFHLDGSFTSDLYKSHWNVVWYPGSKIMVWSPSLPPTCTLLKHPRGFLSDVKCAMSAECQTPNPRQRKVNAHSPGRHIPLFRTVPAVISSMPYLGETDESYPWNQALIQDVHSSFSSSSSLLLYTFKCISIFIFPLIQVNTNVMWK